MRPGSVDGAPDPAMHNFRSADWTIDVPQAGITPLGIALAGLENEEKLLEITRLQITTLADSPEKQHVSMNVTTPCSNDPSFFSSPTRSGRGRWRPSPRRWHSRERPPARPRRSPKTPARNWRWRTVRLSTRRRVAPAIRSGRSAGCPRRCSPPTQAAAQQADVKAEQFVVTTISVDYPPLAIINGKSYGVGEQIPVTADRRVFVTVRQILDGVVVLDYRGHELRALTGGGSLTRKTK